MNIYWILEEKTPVPTEDVLTWGRFFENTKNRTVSTTDLDDDVYISTVFLGMDYQPGDGPPLLFETLVFRGPLDGEMDRYSTWGEAEAGHLRMVERAKGIMT